MVRVQEQNSIVFSFFFFSRIHFFFHSSPAFTHNDVCLVGIAPQLFNDAAILSIAVEYSHKNDTEEIKIEWMNNTLNRF